MRIKAYAGIGSREISEGEEKSIISIATKLSKAKWICYSGNAPGSDQAFQLGSNGRCAIFLPWDSFEIKVQHDCIFRRDVGDSKVGDYWTREKHPIGDSLSQGARRLMNRNAHQILGHQNGLPMVTFVVCCATPVAGKNKVEGGTNHAVQIAHCLGIPVFNIRVKGWRTNLKQFLLEQESL